MRASFHRSKRRHHRSLQLDRLEERQLLSTITVNTTADDATADATLSLREAIEISDGTLAVTSLSTQEQAQVSGTVGATNTIDFNIPTTDPGYNATAKVWTIALKSALPTISTNAAIIDGYSQPGAARNTLAHGDNAKLKIAISGAGLVGLTIGQPGSQVFGLDIEDCSNGGVLITAAGNVQVAGCFIGTDPSGETAAPNGYGVEIENSSNLIGGPSVGDRNVISGNNYSGVSVPATGTSSSVPVPTGNRIENNFIGIDAAGTKALANGLDSDGPGVLDSGSGDIYGGTTAGLGNVISGNWGGGILSYGSITIEGNDIGTDANGDVALGNGGSGFGGITAKQLSPGAPVISTTITGNVVSGNSSGGIAVYASSQPSQATFLIANNLIGTNAAGTAALGNAGTGLRLSGLVENAKVLDNVISATTTGSLGSASYAVSVVGSGATDVENNVFQGNLIGTDKTGTVPLGNTGLGMDIEANGNTIGGTGPGQGNVIAYSGHGGISVIGGQDPLIQNSIFGNSGAGISYQAIASNQHVAPPVMTFTPGGAGGGTLSGTLTESPNQTYVVEIFSNPSLPTPGQEQGKTFIKDVTVKTDSSGNGTFSVSEPIAIYTATATNPDGNTSAFSNAVGSQSLPASQTVVSSSANPSTVGQSVTFTAVVAAPGSQQTPTGTVTFTIDGQAQAPVALAVVGGADEAQFTTSTLAAGSHTVSAAYSGDADVAASRGSLPTQTVNTKTQPGNPQATITTMAFSPSPADAGATVTFTALVTPAAGTGTPTGTITFTLDGTAEPPVPLQVVGGSDQATFSIATLAPGTHTIVATYSGDSTFAGSATQQASETIKAPTQPGNPQATATTVVSSASPSAVGATVTFTATVAPTNGSGTPTGGVTFTIDGVAQRPVPLRMVGGHDQATFSTATLAAGTHTIVAAYDGDATFAASTMPHSLTQVVVAQTPTGTPSSRPVAKPPVVVSLKRYGIHKQPTRLVFTFSTAMDPARAQDVRNYLILSPARHEVPVRRAVYDPTAKTLTLRPRRRINLHATYYVAINAIGADGVADTQSVLLDGYGAGQAGNDYVSPLNRKNLVLTPSEMQRRIPRWLFQKPTAASPTPGPGPVSGAH